MLFAKKVPILVALLASPLANAEGMRRLFNDEKPLTGERRAPEGDAALSPAQQPIERQPGLSTSPVLLGVDTKGNFGITSIDRNHETTKQWIKDGVITEAQIKRIESGEVVDVELPEAH